MKMKNMCPKCGVLLSGLSCDRCGGSLMGLAVLDLVAPRGFQKKCVEHVQKNGRESKRECPTCLKNMTAVTLQESEVELDFCLSCHQVWFDANEIKLLPKKSEVDKALDEAERMVGEAQRANRILQADIARTRRMVAYAIIMTP